MAKTENGYWPSCGCTDCSREPCVWVDGCGVGFCDECADDDPHHTFRATSIHCFCPVWLLGMFLVDKGIDGTLSPGKDLIDLFYCDERYRQHLDCVFLGPVMVKERDQAEK